MSSKASAGPSNMTIIGMAILLFGSILLGVGIHHLIATGTCSSTGYSSDYGPVPTCPSGTGAWVGFLFGGIVLGLIGGFMLASSGPFSISPIFFGIFGGIGFGAMSLLIDSKVASGSQVFGGIFGACFAVVGVGAGIAMIRGIIGTSGGSTSKPSRSSSASARIVSNAFSSSSGRSSRGTSSSPRDAVSGMADLSRTLRNVVSQAGAPSSASSDPLDQVEKLAALHSSGALTDEEFAREKAKILGET
ncbi:MAG: SHOCT domain-containing protein [Solirubrobacteraceae bacterium]